jgi:DNA helicase-2/ATP-dependent DNA helicase PcrA
MSRQKGDDVSRLTFLDTKAASYIDEAIAEAWERYDVILKKEKALDFDDILVDALKLLREHAHVREHFRAQWSHIHVDEYQDTNRVQYELIKTLSGERRNIAVVGDVDQCVVAGTRVTMRDGTTRAVERIRVGDEVLSNYGSGDMRGAHVSAVHTRTATKDLVRITTLSGAALTTTPEHTHFAGYRLGVSTQQYFTYLMYKKGMGWRLGVTQVYTKGQRNPIVGFKLRTNQEHADALWIIGVHASMQEARISEYTLSLSYRIPTLPFVARKGLSVNGYVHDQKALKAIFDTFHTDTSAQKLLEDYHLSPGHPHHRAQSRDSNRRNITLTLCGDRRGKKPMHRISMTGNDAIGARTLTKLGLSVRTVKNGSKSWRFETANSSYGEVRAIAEQIQRAFPDAVIIEKARLGKGVAGAATNSLDLLPAASVLPGMSMYTQSGTYDVVTRTVRIPSTAQVYDIDVENTHNYVANGILTHNCIYSWRGASIEHIMNFEHDYPEAEVVVLTQNYRSTKTILAAANQAIEKNIKRREKVLVTDNPDGDRIKLGGFSDEVQEAYFVAHEAGRLIRAGVNPNMISVLYRANFQSRILEEAFLHNSIPYQVLGTRFFERKEVKDALSYLRVAVNPDSVADITRTINTPVRGIGKVTLAKLISHGRESLSGAQREKVEGFYRLLARIREKVDKEKPSQVMKYILDESGLNALYREGSEEDEERAENLRELVTVATKYDTFPLGDGIDALLEEAALQSDQDELSLREQMKKNGVKLMTVHAAKGLEFDTVFITGLEDGLFPHARDGDDSVDTEEERRLFYVAITRARKTAYMTYALTRRIFGTSSVNMPSVFINELDPALTEVVESIDSREQSYGTGTIYL